MKIVEPEIGCWYQCQIDQQQFEVVAIDDREETIEIQHVDGDIEEFDYDTWYRSEVQVIAAPEDWLGPYELDDDDFNQEGTIQPQEWNLLSKNEFDKDL